MEPSDADLKEYLNVIGERRIDEDIQSKLREILKCGVCYEIPVEKDLKIRTCEKGHHFCSDCFQKLKHCGICRGQFLLGRNFVVEDIITQLGAPFGLTKSELPPPEKPVKIIPGLFTCLHQCFSKIRGVNMLEHIRKIHNKNLFDDVRSNPYLRVFNCTYQIQFAQQKTFVSSFHVSDMGLFTVIIKITDTHLLGSAHMLASPPILYNFQCKLTVKISKHCHAKEFSISDCDLYGYNYDKDFILNSDRSLKVELGYLCSLVKEGDNIQVFFSVWKKPVNQNMKKANSNYKQLTMLPQDTAVFKSDRKERRNKQRNVRKRRNRKVMREKKATDDLLSKFENFSIVL